jgi:hypothetical protein
MHAQAGAQRSHGKMSDSRGKKSIKDVVVAKISVARVSRTRQFPEGVVRISTAPPYEAANFRRR